MWQTLYMHGMAWVFVECRKETCKKWCKFLTSYQCGIKPKVRSPLAQTYEWVSECMGWLWMNFWIRIERTGRVDTFRKYKKCIRNSIKAPCTRLSQKRRAIYSKSDSEKLSKGLFYHAHLQFWKNSKSGCQKLLCKQASYIRQGTNKLPGGWKKIVHKSGDYGGCSIPGSRSFNGA